MKANNWNWCSLKTIYVLAVISLFIYLLWGPQFNGIDSQTYMVAWDSILSGNIDKWRTPTYPIFIGLFKSIIEDKNVFILIILAQYLLFFISIRYFYKITSFLIPSITIGWFLTLVYALHPGIAYWNSYIMTEALSISISVFLLYSVSKILRQSYKNIIYFTWWLILLIFLRPSFLYLLPIFILFWFYMAYISKSMRKMALICLTCVCSITGIECAYIYKFYQCYGIISPTGISTINQYFLARENGILKPEHIEDEGLKAFVMESIDKNGIQYEQCVEIYFEAEKAINTFGLKSVSEAIDNSKRNELFTWVKKAIKRTYVVSQSELFQCNWPHPLNATKILFKDIISGTHISSLYLLLLIYLGFIIKQVHQKSNYCYSSLLLLLGSSNIFIIIIGAFWDWSRLIVPSLPIYLLMFGQLCNLIRLTIVPNEQLE